MVINFSAQTSSNSLQDTVEGKLEKRTKVRGLPCMPNTQPRLDLSVCLPSAESLGPLSLSCNASFTPNAESLGPAPSLSLVQCFLHTQPVGGCWGVLGG
jgi:hypothetical protein